MSTEDTYCRGCGYDLRAFTTPQCPECGLTLDPADPNSFLRSLAKPNRWLLWMAIAGVLMMAESLVLGRVFGRFGVMNSYKHLCIFLLLGGFFVEVLTMFLATAEFLTRFRDRRIRYGRGTLQAAFAISFSVVVVVPGSIAALIALGFMALVD